MEVEEKNGVKDSLFICFGVERRLVIFKNVGVKFMFIICFCYLINIVINIYVVNSFFFYINYFINRKLGGLFFRGCE